MSQTGRSSFRRILLSRILLLSIPVLLLGEVVTYKKARSSLLETARQNITESAIRKGEDLKNSIENLQSNLLTASETTIFQSESAPEIQAFLLQLQHRLPGKVRCLQVTDAQLAETIATTCPTPLQLELSTLKPSWTEQQGTGTNPILQLKPSKQQSGGTEPLSLLFHVPVYDANQRLRYILSSQTILHQENESDKPGSLSGYTVVVDQDGTILSHPQIERVGRNIQQEVDYPGLREILRDAIEFGEANVRHTYGFASPGWEWLVGYDAVRIPVSAHQNRTWVVMAVAQLDNALYGLEGIKQILMVLTLGLIATIFLATLYMSRELSRPLEQLGKYALYIQRRHTTETAPKNPDLSEAEAVTPATLQVPKNFTVRELNQLAEALDSMVQRLEERAEELETAWREAQAANQLKSQFLANTSHELRTPLNAIIGCLRLVQDGCCDSQEEELEFLKRADDAAIHLLKIINDLLDLSRIEAGTMKVSLEIINLEQVLKEVLDLQIVPIQQKQLDLKLNPLSQAIWVRADPAKLKQVLLNVIGNAVKFTDRGGITIDHRFETVEIGDRQIQTVILSIQDTGIGINPDQQHRLFTPFVMVDGSTTRRYEGTGLGLAISRNLMHLMGGNIALYSQGLGEGTIVEISLPVLAEARELAGLNVPLAIQTDPNLPHEAMIIS